MTYFTSYAQNSEDVLLWRALRHVETGFYIDVGANDPHAHSVTQAFYERGWRGINIEPLPHFAPRFAELRTRDINLSMAAGDSDGEITLYDVPAVDGWASSDPAIARQHSEDGFRIVELTVPVRRLTTICEEYVTGEIHFLKVDVEGFETAVLQGMDFARWQPWIVVVEATLPNSQVTNHDQWEPLLLAHGYQFAYFDGLNRYYVAPGHPELLPALTLQPNVFDNFHTIHLVRAWAARDAALDELAALRACADNPLAMAIELTHQLRNAQARATALEERRNQAQQQLADTIRTIHATESMLAERESLLMGKIIQVEVLDARIKEIYRSPSWVLSRPLRAIGYLVRKLLRVETAPERPPTEREQAEAAAPEKALKETLQHLPAPARKVLADLEASGKPSEPTP